MRKSMLLSVGVYLLGMAMIFPISNANSAGYEPTTPAPVAATPTSTPTTSAAPVTTPVKSVATELTKVNSMISKKDFKAARSALLLLDKEFANNADINNLLGFASRNLKDYRGSATYYTKALRINPNHLGAIEYQGELFITTKKIADAKKNLQKLKTLCGVNCEEYKDLKKAIGNR
jgi:tetratricopeptide (TPR) repeat protein